MASLLEKVNLLVSANLHGLVNTALRANSVAVLDEQIRRAHESQDQLEDTIATVMADVAVETGKNAALKESVVHLDRNARTLLAAGKEGQAAILVAEKQVKDAALKRSDASLVSQTADLEKLRQAQGALKVKITDLQTTRDNVDQALRIAKTKRIVVRTFDQLTDVLQESGAAGIADWADRVKAKEDAKLDMTLEKHVALLDPLANPDVSAEIERMKAEMGK